MGIQDNPYPLRIDKALLEKIRILAKENSRSINKEIEFALKQYILNYEKENGVIVLSADTNG